MAWICRIKLSIAPVNEFLLCFQAFIAADSVQMYVIYKWWADLNPSPYEWEQFDKLLNTLASLNYFGVHQYIGHICLGQTLQPVWWVEKIKYLLVLILHNKPLTIYTQLTFF